MASGRSTNEDLAQNPFSRAINIDCHKSFFLNSKKVTKQRTKNTSKSPEKALKDSPGPQNGTLGCSFLLSRWGSKFSSPPGQAKVGKMWPRAHKFGPFGPTVFHAKVRPWIGMKKGLPKGPFLIPPDSKLESPEPKLDSKLEQKTASSNQLDITEGWLKD